ncbi:MAG: AGE family epimerase/isomerase [Pseudomonadota bacterium]
MADGAADVSNAAQQLAARVSRAEHWLGSTFALWSSVGVHRNVGFHEALTLDGAVKPNATSRVRVQARQTFSFALFEAWGEPGARDLVRHGLDALTGHCPRSDGLFGRRMSHAGGLSDATADLYDNAFVLLALSKAAALGHGRAADAADALSHAIDTQFARPPEEGGFFEVLPVSDVRLQNPHMHLFEASLVHHAATGHTRSAARANAIEGLMANRFLSAEGGLREVFQSDWSVHEGDRYETGHQFEWVWLLREKAKVLGGAVHPATGSLYAVANRLSGPDGEVFLAHHLSGSLKDSTQRCWGVTEALKAHLASHEAGDEAAAGRAAEAFDRLFDQFLDPAPAPGGWVDQYDGLGNPLSHTMPASTGYHVYLALAEFLRVAGAQAD